MGNNAPKGRVNMCNNPRKAWGGRRPSIVSTFGNDRVLARVRCACSLTARKRTESTCPRCCSGRAACRLNAGVRDHNLGSTPNRESPAASTGGAEYTDHGQLFFMLEAAIGQWCSLRMRVVRVSFIHYTLKYSG